MDTTEAQTQTQTDVVTVTQQNVLCPKCGRGFRNEKGLAMHTVRKHSGRGWDTSRNFRKQNTTTREQQLQQRRDYNRRLRARYYAEGKNSRGEQMPPGWKPRYRYQPPRRGGNIGMKLAPWSPERRAKFNSTWRSKMQGKRKKIAPIVYPNLADSELTRLQENEKRIQDEGALIHIPTLTHCPHCGEHVAGWKYQP